MDLTPTQRLAGLLIGEPLAAFVERSRSEGKAWRHIARDLYNATNGEIDVTPETLRAWHAAAPTAVAS